MQNFSKIREPFLFGREGGGTSTIGAVRSLLGMLKVSQLGNVEGFRTHSQFRNVASGLIGALRFACGFKKIASYLLWFSFFQKYHRLWNLMSELFPLEKVFPSFSKKRQIYLFTNYV